MKNFIKLIYKILYHLNSIQHLKIAIIFFKFPSMFSKIKSVFTGKNENQKEKASNFDHSTVNSQNISECPFMNKKNNPQFEGNDKKCPVKDKEKKQRQDSDLSSEQDEMPKGGCPFMKTSDKKKNPNLGISHEGYDQPFVSKFKYYLSENKLNIMSLRNKKINKRIKREKFENYPIYLQHTLFFTGQDFKKVRSFECCSRFMAYEELREKGNKLYNKGKYAKALEYYERAMSLFRWLQYHQMKENDEKSELSVSQIHSQQESIESKVNLNLNSEEEIKSRNPQKDDFDEIENKYKEFFIIYDDNNVVQHNGQELEEEADIDMRKSLTLQIYINMASAYIHLNNFSVAKQICNDALELSEKVSQVFFRKSQSIIFDKSSTLEQAEQALKLITHAIQMKPTEKIFQKTNENILKMMNIHDAQEVYHQLALLIKEKIEEKAQIKRQKSQKIEKRLRQINQIQKRIISEGKTPQENKKGVSFESTHEYRTILRMKSKYVRILQFYSQAKNKEQVRLAKLQFQEILKIISEIKEVLNIFIDYNKIQFGENSQKIILRTNYLKKQTCQQFVNKGKYNFSVLEWVIKEIVKEQEQEKEKLRKLDSENSEQGQEVDSMSKKSKWISKLPYAAAVIMPIIGIALNYAIF